MKVPKSFENPLISHARMRAMYRALVETRMLSKRLPRAVGLPLGLEACWVGTAMDLNNGDLTSDTGGGAVIEYIRAVGARGGNGVPGRAAVRHALELRPQRFPGSTADRMMCAIGAAMAGKAPGDNRVVLAYLRKDELTAGEWKRVFAVAREDEIPLVIVAVPPRARQAGNVSHDLQVLTQRGMRPPRNSLRTCAVPVIPVDTSDAVALLRVSQETMGRARVDRRMAVIECIPTGADPVGLMGTQLIRKGIATERWVSSVKTSFAAMLAEGK